MTSRGIVSQALAAIVIGAFIGWWRSFSLLDPFFLVTFLSSSVILMGPVVAQIYTAEGDATRIVRRAVLHATMTVTGALVVALIWINVQWSAELLLPPLLVLIAGIALSVAIATLGGFLMILALRRFARPVALRAFRFAILTAVLAYYLFPSRWSVTTTESVMEHGVTPVVAGMALLIAGLDLVLWRRVERAA